MINTGNNTTYRWCKTIIVFIVVLFLVLFYSLKDSSQVIYSRDNTCEKKDTNNQPNLTSYNSTQFLVEANVIKMHYRDQVQNNLLGNNNYDAFFYKSYNLRNYNISFEGEGTKDQPYLINNYEDLIRFRDSINTGSKYVNTYFRQTSDISIRESDWTPIGIYGSKNYFAGIYDGNGKIISNLVCKTDQEDQFNNNGLFGQLGGVVVNLIIKDAYIEGNNCGIITSTSVPDEEKVAIINCFVSGNVNANYSGGIAGSLDYGLISGCISDVNLISKAEHIPAAVGGICEDPNKTKIYGCISTTQLLPDVNKVPSLCFTTDRNEMNNNQFILNYNIRLSLIQQLFGNYYDVNLIQVKMFDDNIHYSGNNIINVIGFINEYCLFILVAPILIFHLKHIFKNEDIERKKIIAYLIIFGIVSLFLNCALIAKIKTVSFGALLFVLACNIIFLLSLYTCVKKYKPVFNINLKLFFGFLLIFALSIIQFKDVPRYDAHLYYSSLMSACEHFNVDLLTYIGSFICYGRVHQASSLLLASFEFLLPGKMIGVYISMLIITVITYYVFYKLIQELIPGISKTNAVISSLILILSPYQIGLLSYLSYDNLCVYYAIWMIYYYKKKNNLLVSFCGYLLLFTKITGGVFYVVFLIVASLIEVLNMKKESFIQRVLNWWDWKRSVLWVAPGILYLVLIRIRSWVTIQFFPGSYAATNLITVKPFVSYGNSFLQFFVFGFRWTFVLIVAIYVIKRIIHYNYLRFENENSNIIISSIIACLFCFIVLLLYNGNAECPRYTSIANVMYSLSIPFILKDVFNDDFKYRIALSVIAIILFVQFFFTIDPMIIANNNYLDMGNNRLYSLSLKNDNRSAMKLDIGTGYGTVGDVFAYNREYNYCNDLLRQAFSDINLSEKDNVYVLDVLEYEFHIRGYQNYNIYWNKKTKSFTYSFDNDCIVIDCNELTTSNIEKKDYPKGYLENDFYIIAPARVNTDNALKQLENMGYIKENYQKYVNNYGEIIVIKLTKA